MRMNEIASGGTMAEAAAFVTKHGASEVILGATHAVLTKQAPQLLQAAPEERDREIRELRLKYKAETERLHESTTAIVQREVRLRVVAVLLRVVNRTPIWAMQARPRPKM